MELAILEADTHTELGYMLPPLSHVLLDVWDQLKRRCLPHSLDAWLRWIWRVNQPPSLVLLELCLCEDDSFSRTHWNATAPAATLSLDAWLRRRWRVMRGAGR